MHTLHSVMFALAAASFAVAYLTLKIKELRTRHMCRNTVATKSAIIVERLF